MTPYQSAARNAELTYVAKAMEVCFGLPKMPFGMSLDLAKNLVESWTKAVIYT